MRIVIDTNVLVSALKGGITAQILNLWRTHMFDLVITDEIRNEYQEVMKRPKLNIPSELQQKIISDLDQFAIMVQPQEQITFVATDPTDNKFLEAAVAGSADVIVSGDKRDLLPLQTFRSIPIVTVRTFLETMLFD